MAKDQHQMTNPLRVDPTRSATLRRQFAVEARYRFNVLGATIQFLLEEERVLEQWGFLTDAQKVDQFFRYIDAYISNEITGETKLAGNWLKEYLSQAYAKGQDRSYSDVRALEKRASLYIRPDKKKPARKLVDNAGGFESARREFLRTNLGSKQSRERVDLLASQALSELKGLTATMRKELHAELVAGITKGQDPRKIARAMQKKIEAIGKARSRSLVQTEITRAHAEGQLDALEALGVEHVQVAVEWRTAGDNHVCLKCRPLSGVVLTLQEARGLLPRHIGCRCAFMPANIGEPTDGQKRTYQSITSAIRKSLAADKKKEAWAGSMVQISRTRPKPLQQAKRKK